MTVTTLLSLACLSSAASATGEGGSAAAEFSFGPPTDLLTDDGPMSFGLIVSADVVSWSAPDAQDLLVARCWEGVFLYPSKDLRNFGEPIQLCDQLGHAILMVEPFDWDGDGRQEAIGTDREGNILCLRRVGEYPNLRLEAAQDPLVAPDALPFNIPFVNPKYKLSDRPESLWPQHFNYTYPTRYCSAGTSAPDLILGDWGGVLWYLPRVGVRDGLPVFAGQAYTKRDGTQFARPKHLLVDEQGETLLMGEGKVDGIRYPGGASRPVMYRNESTRSDDLMVLCGMIGRELRYLRRVASGPEGEPVFQDLGEVSIEGMPDDGYDPYSYHAVVTAVGDGPWPDLLLTRGCDVAVCRNQQIAGPVPAFRFSHWIAGEDVPTRGYNFTEILTDPRGRRYLLENDTTWHFRELMTADGELRVSSKRHPLRDQDGVFRVEGETDAQHGANWGFHRAALWDYDGSGKQHLIVGTDKGLLYLLRQDRPLGRKGRFEFQSVGPLHDTDGSVIRVHHRVVAAPIDLDADGRLDLVLAGATYGRGDPSPGSGIYFTRNIGLRADGTPVLSQVEPLEMSGHQPPDFKGLHAQLQALDLLGNGERVLVVGTQRDDYFRGHVYRPAKDRIALEHAGMTLPPISIEERLLDLDGDGSWEYVRSGGESLIARYAKLMITRNDRETD